MPEVGDPLARHERPLFDCGGGEPRCLFVQARIGIAFAAGEILECDPVWRGTGAVAEKVEHVHRILLVRRLRLRDCSR